MRNIDSSMEQTKKNKMIAIRKSNRNRVYDINNTDRLHRRFKESEGGRAEVKERFIYLNKMF